MQVKRARSLVGLVGALIAGLIAVSSAYVSWILIDKSHLGWTISRGVAFVALIVGVLSLLLLFGGFETSKKVVPSQRTIGVSK
jgi:uncharacterized membrane protein